jgi:hypothetical protein
MDNEADVGTHSDRPKILVFRLVELVKAHPGINRIHLQVKGRRFGSLLFVTCETREAVSEGIGDQEVHGTITTDPLIARAIRRTALMTAWRQAIILAYLEHFHDFVSKMVDDFYGDAPRLWFSERSRGIAVQRGPSLGVDFGF